MTDKVSGSRLDVLVVGQVPPPVGGQSLIIQKLLEGDFRRVRLHHVRMQFSKEMKDVAKFQITKVFRLFGLIARILCARIKTGARVLYYPPSPPDKISMYRDLAILLSVRWCFSRTVLHFHAGGISELYEKLSAPMRLLYRAAFHHADAAIRLCELNPPDGSRLLAKRDFIIPYGIEDHYKESAGSPESGRCPRILFVGVLRESKGVGVLVEACRRLKERRVDFALDLMGGFQDEPFRRKLLDDVPRYGLEGHIDFLGELTGEEKWKAYRRASIFCFPSFFEGETFGIVMLEAMQFKLPVVAARWRAAPTIVKEGETGFIVPARDSERLAERLEYLLRNPAEAKEMGERGRRLFLEKYQMSGFYRNMEQVFLAVADGAQADRPEAPRP